MKDNSSLLQVLTSSKTGQVDWWMFVILCVNILVFSLQSQLFFHTEITQFFITRSLRLYCQATQISLSDHLVSLPPDHEAFTALFLSSLLPDLVAFHSMTTQFFTTRSLSSSLPDHIVLHYQTSQFFTTRQHSSSLPDHLVRHYYIKEFLTTRSHSSSLLDHIVLH